MRGISHEKRRPSRAFSLVELMVSTTVVMILLTLMISVVMHTSSVWRRSSGDLEAFQSARVAFEIITRNLSQATLNTYLDYDSVTAPSRYLRKSELAFLSGPAGLNNLVGTLGTGQAVFFQSPLGYATNTAAHGGLEGVMNTCGYYVSFTTNNSIPAHVSSTGNSYRYRLMQMLVPSESNDIYKNSAGTSWFSSYVNRSSPVADNIIALVIRPQDPVATPPDVTSDYSYDTRAGTTANPQPDNAHQLPPVLQVTMVAIDEASAKRLENGGTQPGAITAALSGKFEDPVSFDTDLADLEAQLSAAHIPYRVFSSAVPIHESKWTK